MSNAQLKTIEEFVRFHHHLAAYQVIQSGFRLGVIRVLLDGQKTSLQVAEELKLDPWKTELLCSALCETGLLERYDEDFALSPLARLLPQEMPDSPPWTPKDFESTAVVAGLEGMPLASNIEPHQWTQTPAALDAAEAMDIGRSRRGFRILEVGGGEAVFSSVMAHRDPYSQVTLIDHESNLEKARTIVESVGIDKQFEMKAGDYRDPIIPPGEFDLILVAGLLHRFPDSCCSTWISKLAKGLKPEGDLAIIDWFHGQPKGARTLAFLELATTIKTPEARLHRPPFIRDWMIEAGLTNIQFAYLPSPPHIWGLVLGQKKASRPGF